MEEEIVTRHAGHFGSDHFRNLLEVDRDNLRKGFRISGCLECNVRYFKYDAFETSDTSDAQVDLSSRGVLVNAELCSHIVRKNRCDGARIHDEVSQFPVRVQRNEQQIAEIP